MNRAKHTYAVVLLQYALVKCHSVSTLDSQKPEIHRFCFLVHFGANRFTFERFLPPPPSQSS